MKIIKVKNSGEGFKTCKSLLYEKVSSNTVLFLSGGSTPKSLYESLSKEKRLQIGAVGMIDERYGERLHEDSNEKMIRDTGLIERIEERARFYPILENKDIEETARDYDETLRFLFNYFPKSVGILGVGIDGHTAGIPAIPEISQKILDDKSSLACFYEDRGVYKKRITQTFLALSRLDLLIVLVFGKEKKESLGLMFKKGSEANIPARFFLQKEITDKVVLITDQKLRGELD